MVLLVAVSAATTAACSDVASSIAQPNPSGPASSVASSGRQYTVRSNSEKYSDSGSEGWHGQSAEGQEVWSRALIDQTGNVTLEVATAAFESGVPTTGQIDRMEVRAGSDEHQVKLKFKNLPGNSGAVSLSLGHLTRNTPLEIKANVGDVSGKKTDEVDAETVVKFRPDLRVFALTVVPRVRVNQPFDVSATVSEIKGDVGARADCVLKADGVEVDRVTNMWVDAKGSVSCAFRAPGFQTSGAHTVTVTLAREGPADYDLSNNAATQTLQAGVDPIQLGYEVTVRQQVGHSKSVHSIFRTGSNGSRSSTELDVDSDHSEQLAIFTAWARQPVRPPAGTRIVGGSAATLASVSFSEASGGVTVESLRAAGIRIHLNYGTVDGFGGGCFWTGQLTDGFTLSVCTGWNAAGVGDTFVQYQRFANRVLYISKNYSSSYDPANGVTVTNSYYLDAGTSLGGRPFVPYLASSAFSFYLDGGTFAFTASPSVLLTSAPYNADTAKLCSLPSAITGGTEYGCDQFFDSGVLTTGHVSTGDPNAVP